MAYITALASQFRTPTGYLCNTESATFVKENVGLYRLPNRPWKTSGALANGTSYIGANLGSALTNAAIIIDNINIASVKIEASASASWTSLTTNTVAVTQNPLNGRYCLYYDTSAYPSRQYWRVLANSASTTDGASAMSCGSLIFCSSVTTWPGGSGEYAEMPLESVRPNDDYAGGGAEPVILGNRSQAITLGQSPASRADMRAPLLTLLGQGIGRYFVFYKNDSDPSEVYVCRRAADVTVRQTTPTAIEYTALILQGAV